METESGVKWMLPDIKIRPERIAMDLELPARNDEKNIIHLDIHTKKFRDQTK